MTPVVVDTSALAAVAFEEREAATIERRLRGAPLFAPTLLRYELANVAWKKMRQHPRLAPQLARALGTVLDGEWNIAWRDVNLADAALIGHAIGVSPYDAAYLWLAGVLDADLVTLDSSLARASAALAQDAG
jgi:predicted nucleic acid-binding protein